MEKRAKREGMKMKKEEKKRGREGSRKKMEEKRERDIKAHYQ